MGGAMYSWVFLLLRSVVFIQRKLAHCLGSSRQRLNQCYRRSSILGARIHRLSDLYDCGVFYAVGVWVMALDYLSLLNRSQFVHGPYHQHERSRGNLVSVINWDFGVGDKNRGPQIDVCAVVAVVATDFEAAELSVIKRFKALGFLIWPEKLRTSRRACPYIG